MLPNSKKAKIILKCKIGVINLGNWTRLFQTWMNEYKASWMTMLFVYKN